MKTHAAFVIAILVTSVTSFSQSKIISGKVVQENGDALPFITVTIKQTQKAVITDDQGLFLIKANINDELIFSAVNFQSTEIQVTSVSDITVVLKRIANALPDVIITSAFNIKKEQHKVPYSAQVIESDVLNIIPQTNLNDALAGKIAGVQFRSQSGAKLNSQSFLRVRGGLLLSGDAGPIYVVDGTVVGSVDIDPSLIENITVLKGANAAAIFGGAINGAIVITTKKMKYGKSSIQVNQGLTLDKVGKLPKFQNMYAGGGITDLIQYVWKPGDPGDWKALDGKYFHDYTDDASWGPKIEGQEYIPWYAWVPGTKYSFKTASLVPQPDNIKDFWKTGVTSNTNINFSKAGEGYSTRLFYSKQIITGIIPDSKSDRNILSANVQIDMNKFLTTGIDLSYNEQNIHGDFNDGFINTTTGNFYQWNQRDLDMGIMKELRGFRTPIGNTASWNWRSNPNAYDAADPSGFYGPLYWFNFYTFLDNEKKRQQNESLFGNAFIKAKIRNDLSIKGTVRLFRYTLRSEDIANTILGPTIEHYYTGLLYNQNVNYELLLTYHNIISKEIELNVIAGGTSTTGTFKSIGASTSGGLIIPDLYDLSNSGFPPYIGDNRSRYKDNSLFAAGDVGYKKLITTSWSLRQVWYSTLPEKDNSLFYPSLGISYIPFIFQKGFLSSLKVYGSWGKVPIPLGIYNTNTSFYVSPAQWNNNFLMTAPDVIPDENLRGGLITSYEAGIDLKFLSSRIGVNVNYYYETSKDQPIQINVDAVSGVTSKLINAATVKRQGIELVLNSVVTSNKNFTWNATSTFGWLIKNPVTKIIEGQEKVQPYGWKSSLDRNSFASAYMVLEKNWGQLIGGGYSRNADGIPLIDPATGLYIAGDPNHNWGGVVPKITGGLQNLFTYKNISFNFSLDYQFGGHFYSCSEYWGNYSGVLEPTAVVNDNGANVRDAVSEGGGVHVTGVSSVDGRTPVDMYVDAFTYYHQFRAARIAEPYIHGLSYVKLRELAVGYNLPVKKWKFANNYLQEARVAFVARNPWLIYTEAKNFDPSEISLVYGEEGQLPPVRSYGLSLSFTF